MGTKPRIVKHVIDKNVMEYIKNGNNLCIQYRLRGGATRYGILNFLLGDTIPHARKFSFLSWHRRNKDVRRQCSDALSLSLRRLRGRRLIQYDRISKTWRPTETAAPCIDSQSIA